MNHCLGRTSGIAFALLLLFAGLRAWAPPPRTLEAVSVGSGYRPADALPWEIERVDAPRTFEYMDSRSLILDAADRPHIAYGADHLYHAFYDGSRWNREVVDPAWGVGRYASLALDGTGKPHISYADDGNDDLKYAWHDGSAWHIEVVDSVGDVGRFTSLALDSDAHPHISYYDDTNDHLRYAYSDGTSWQVETVDSAETGGAFTSLALDGAGRPHISYWGQYSLKYAWHDGSTWQTVLVDYPSVYGATSLVLDSSGWPRISYYHMNQGALKYARYDGATWYSETVDSSGDVGYYSSLVLDAADSPRISYNDRDNGDLKYAAYDGTAWQTQTVASAGVVGLYTSIALDSAGQPHVSHCGDGNLHYARYDGFAWSAETVDVGGTVGRYSSLAVDGSGLPHISYYDASLQDLRYAWHDGTGWYSETVDSLGDVGQYSSLALDTLGHPHISYFDATNFDLRYVWHDGTGWVSTTVDSQGYVGEHTSLALDHANRPHISYCQTLGPGGTCIGLRYAYYSGSTWQIETVDDQWLPGYYTSLVLDQAGRPHISYGDDSVSCDSCLKYAFHDGLSWHIEIVDSGRTSLYSSLSLDAAGCPRISYYDSRNVDLKHAWRDCVTQGEVPPWHTEVIDGAGYAGWDTSLAVDTQGRSRISYIGGYELRYAWQDSTGWYTQTVDGGACGYGTSLALGSGEQPYVSYHDTTSGDLKWAHPCIGVSGAEVKGPRALLVNQEGTYQALALPLIASAPISCSWSSGTVAPTATYSWPVTGTFAVAVTLTNGCGLGTGGLTVRVLEEWPFAVYLPLVWRP